jgi:hypothetical protein
MVKRASWLSVTPEPERELPAAVATLALGHAASAQAIGAERSRIERLVLRGSERRWLAYRSRPRPGRGTPTWRVLAGVRSP